jgi:alpha-galactosidase
MLTYEPVSKKTILTPPAPDTPRINGPLVYGVRHGHPFLYRIPCTGVRPIRFSADGLPDGLTLDSKTGIIRGTISDKTKQSYTVKLKAKNSLGSDSASLRLLSEIHWR